MTPNEFVLWLNGFLDAVSEIEGYHLIKIKNKLKDVNDNPLPDYTKPYTEPLKPYVVTCTTTGDIPFIYNTEDQYLKKEILKG